MKVMKGPWMRQESAPDDSQNGSSKAIYHWYDLTCPFCYIAQARNRILLDRGLVLAELPFQAHPEIPIEGLAMQPRSGPMYVMLEREAALAGLPINWPNRLPNSRRALAAAEWTRLNAPEKFRTYQRELFSAHFALHEDLGSDAVILRVADGVGVNATSLEAALHAQASFDSVDEGEAAGRRAGVAGTPAWSIGGRLISGLQPRELFERIATGH